MKIQTGTYAAECYKCKDAMLVMRIGRMDAISKVARCTCRCETCKTTRQVDMQIELIMKKYMGYWEVHFGELRMGSGKTMVEAMEQAKRRMNNCGYELAKGAVK